MRSESIPVSQEWATQIVNGLDDTYKLVDEDPLSISGGTEVLRTIVHRAGAAQYYRIIWHRDRTLNREHAFPDPRLVPVAPRTRYEEIL